MTIKETHEVDENGRPICRVCGKPFKRISKHVTSAHNMSMAEYEMLPAWPGIKEMKEAKINVDSGVEAIDSRLAETERYLAFGVGRVLSFGKTPGGAEDISGELFSEEAQNYIPDLDPNFIPNPSIMEMLDLGTQMLFPRTATDPRALARQVTFGTLLR